MYQSHGSAPAWWSNYQNRLSLFGGDNERMTEFNRQYSPVSSNSAPLNTREMRLLNRMQGNNDPSFDRIYGAASAEDEAWIRQMMGR